MVTGVFLFYYTQTTKRGTDCGWRSCSQTGLSRSALSGSAYTANVQDWWGASQTCSHPVTNSKDIVQHCHLVFSRTTYAVSHLLMVCVMYWLACGAGQHIFRIDQPQCLFADWRFTEAVWPCHNFNRIRINRVLSLLSLSLTSCLISSSGFTGYLVNGVRWAVFVCFFNLKVKRRLLHVFVQACQMNDTRSIQIISSPTQTTIIWDAHTGEAKQQFPFHSGEWQETAGKLVLIVR